MMGTDGEAGMESPFRRDPEIRFVGGARVVDLGAHLEIFGTRI